MYDWTRRTPGPHRFGSSRLLPHPSAPPGPPGFGGGGRVLPRPSPLPAAPRVLPTLGAAVFRPFSLHRHLWSLVLNWICSDFLFLKSTCPELGWK